MAGEKIVVVDDDKEMTLLLEGVLTKSGYKVNVAHDGEEGLSTIHSESPDLVILDIMMPKLDGYEVLQSIKENQATKDIPVMMLTALGLEEDIQKGIQMGATHYLTKPLRTKLLLKCIKTTLEHY